jgi:hypothetical protein
MAQKTEQTQKEKTYTKKEVEKLLQKQKEECAKQIDRDNLSALNAQRKIKNTKDVL